MKTKLCLLVSSLLLLVHSQLFAQEGLNINRVGDVGIGLIDPLSPLHIFRDDNTLDFLRLDSDAGGGAQDRPLMLLQNNGGIRFQFDNRILATSWRFQAATGNRDAFEITKVGTGDIELRLSATGNLEIQGTLNELSDREAKVDIEPVQRASLLTRLATLPISEWSYRSSPQERHVGPMAQDFYSMFGLGSDSAHLSARNMAGISIAAIQALNKQLLESQQEVDDLSSALAGQKMRAEALERRLERLERLIMQQPVMASR